MSNNADFYGVRGLVIKKEPDKLIMENPGYSRTGKVQMRKGGVSVVLKLIDSNEYDKNEFIGGWYCCRKNSLILMIRN